jgi:hypothetical protein
MMRHLMVLLLAGACCHAAAHGAVTVYQVNLSVTVVGSNPPVFGGLVVNGVALAPAGSLTSPAAAALWVGAGILQVEGSRIDYQFSVMEEYSSLSALTFESGGAAEQLWLGSPQFLFNSQSDPRIPSGAMDIFSPDGSEEQHPLYLSSPAVMQRYLYSGSVDDVDLASLLAGSDSGVTVYADNGPDASRPSGVLNTMSAPEPGRVALLTLAWMGWTLRRRRGCVFA